MLTLIGDTLRENGLDNVFVKGNVFVRNRAISNFKVAFSNFRYARHNVSSFKDLNCSLLRRFLNSSLMLAFVDLFVLL